MALIIENGTGVAGADSFVTVAECEAFALAYFGASLAGSPQTRKAHCGARLCLCLGCAGKRVSGLCLGALSLTGLRMGSMFSRVQSFKARLF
jgi:hypothetical protein